MKDNLSDRYDVIIVGAGIGGLVCGCYLASAGLKTLIIEKNANVGGCCTSFTAKGFVFDAFAHSLGGLRDNGVLAIVLRELNLFDRFKIVRHDPSDIFITPQYKISFWNDSNRIINDLKINFPKESSNIDRLIGYLIHSKGGDSIRLKDVTFTSFLDEFMKDEHLKAILALPVLGNAGLPPSMISAFTAVKLYQEFHFDGGYYPEGGMQVFSNVLVERFKEFGGEIILSKQVNNIIMNGSGVSGVVIKDGRSFFSKIVISNADATKTFNNLLNAEVNFSKINEMKKSSSVFSVYIGVDRNIVDLIKDLKSTVWCLFDYNIDAIHNRNCNADFNNIDWFMIFASPDKKGLVISILAPYMDEKYWAENKDPLCEKLISTVKKSFPILDHVNIQFKSIITPPAIEKWTSNSEGAAYGWASTPSQCVVSGLTQNTVINNLYLTGHWTTQTLGVSGVAYMGRDTAKMIIRRHKK